MERFEVGQDRTLAALVDAVERGEPVEIVREGRTVAEVRPVSPVDAKEDEVDRRWAGLGEVEHEAAALVRAMRDDDD